MDEKTLHAIAQRAVQLKMKWCPPTLSHDDLMQEAYVAVLEAEREGIDPAELQRAAEQHVANIIRRESQRRTVPVAGLLEDE